MLTEIKRGKLKTFSSTKPRIKINEASNYSNKNRCKKKLIIGIYHEEFIKSNLHRTKWAKWAQNESKERFN